MGTPPLVKMPGASAGVAVSDAAVSTFNDFKLSKCTTEGGAKANFLVLQIEGDEIVVKEIGNDASLDGDAKDFCKSAFEKTPCFVIVDFKGKVYMLNVISDDLPAKQKMPYSASVSAVQNALSGIRATHQAMDLDEMEEAF